MFKTPPAINLKFHKGYLDPDCLNYNKYLKTDEELKMITKELEEIKMLNIINETSTNIQLLHSEYKEERRDINGHQSFNSNTNNEDSKE